jgi:hypothetical protein
MTSYQCFNAYEAMPNGILVKRQRAGRFFWSTLPKNKKQHFPGYFGKMLIA